MSKDKDPEIEKIIQTDENLREAFNKEITTNTSETSEDIPDFTSGDSDSDDSDSGKTGDSD